MMSPGTSSPPDPGAVRAPEPAPRLGIVIVTWNVARLLARCLATVRAARLGETADVVVVDNASTDDTVDMARAAFPDVRLIANPDNRGFTRGNNQGLRALGVLPPGDTPVDPHARRSSVGSTGGDRGGADPCADGGPGFAGPEPGGHDGAGDTHAARPVVDWRRFRQPKRSACSLCRRSVGRKRVTLPTASLIVCADPKGIDRWT